MVMFLLDSLYMKVVSTLTVFGAKKSPHSKFTHTTLEMGPSPTQLVKLVATLLPSLCQHFEASSAYFQVG